MEQKSIALKEYELNRLKEYVRKILGDDADKYDVLAKYDSTLTYIENKNAIFEDVSSLVEEKMTRTKLKLMEEEDEYRQEQQLTKAISKYEEQLDSNRKSLSQIYEPITRAITKLCQGYSNIVFIKGRGAIGKSYNIRKCLEQQGTQYVEVSGDITEAYLYRLIFENNGKIIWFTDVAKLLMGLKSINLLKTACELEENRYLVKGNYSNKQDDLPNKFECLSRFIFDYNELVGLKLKEDFDALVTRGDFVEFTLSKEDTVTVLNEINKTEWQKEVTKFLIEEANKNETYRLNLRTQQKAFKTYEFSIKNNYNWKEEVKRELSNCSKIRSMLYSLIGNRVISTVELKKLLMKGEYVGSQKTADRRINDWLFLEELYQWGLKERNPYVSINPREVN